MFGCTINFECHKLHVFSKNLGVNFDTNIWIFKYQMLVLLYNLKILKIMLKFQNSKL
jgi:hypothetical protein